MRARDGQVTWVRAVGWFSLGCGLAQLLAPRAAARLIGVPHRRPWVRLAGVRDVAVGAGLLARPSSRAWLWTRAAADVLDAALLGAALRDPHADRRRVGVAASAVASVAAVDILTALRGAPEDGRPEMKAVVTIDRPVDEIYRIWRDPGSHARFMTFVEEVRAVSDTRWRWAARAPGGRVEWEADIVEDVPSERIAWRSVPGSPVETSGRAWFKPAPGARGTVVRVEMEAALPGGAVGGLAGRLFARIKLRRDLSRFKQWLETGEIARAGAPSGPRGPLGKLLRKEELA